MYKDIKIKIITILTSCVLPKYHTNDIICSTSAFGMFTQHCKIQIIVFMVESTVAKCANVVTSNDCSQHVYH